MKHPAGSGGWRNWAGTVTARPARQAQPKTEAEISAAVKGAAAAGLPVRALGSGHSFTPAAATAGLALDLSLWTGVTAADTRSGLVTVRAGTTLRALNAALAELGLALANLGDIDAQTIAGALATGTHGTRARLGGPGPARGAGRGADAGVAPVLGVRGDGERRVRDAVPGRADRAPAHPGAEPARLGRTVRAVLRRRVVPGVRHAPAGPLRRVRIRRST